MSKDGYTTPQERPRFRIYDFDAHDYFEPVFRAYMGEIKELLIEPNGDLAFREYDKTSHESCFPTRYALEQYTGLDDITGKPIYVNDVVVAHPKHRDTWEAYDGEPHKGRVCFSAGRFVIAGRNETWPNMCDYRMTIVEHEHVPQIGE